MLRGANRDLNMPKSAFFTKWPCLFLEKFTLKKKKWGKRAWFNLGPELFRVVERVLNMLKTACIMKSPCLFLEKFTSKKK